MKRLQVLFIAALSLCAAKKEPAWQDAKVLSQDISSYDGGTYTAPMGNGAAVAVPITRTTNRVTIETDKFRMELVESGRSLIVLPVNSNVRFYNDGDWLVFLDSKNKKHKFSVIAMRAVDPREAK